MGRDITFNSAFSSVQMKRDKEKGGLITAATVDKGTNLRRRSSADLCLYSIVFYFTDCVMFLSDFVVCGDVNGNMWFNEPPEISSWSKRKPVRDETVFYKERNFITVVKGFSILPGLISVFNLTRLKTV